MAAWLARIQEAGGWKRHLSEPRYTLVVLRAIAARGDAWREREFHGKERVLDFLFPGHQPPPRANSLASVKEAVLNLLQPRRRAQRHQPPPRLPDDLFPIIARYYWGGAPV